MSLFAVIVPGSLSYDASSPDQTLRNLTVLFGNYAMYSALSDPLGGTLPDGIVRRGRQPGAFCARSGNWFPGEHLTRDGQGRIVGDIFYTEGVPMPPDDPWPQFGS